MKKKNRKFLFFGLFLALFVLCLFVFRDSTSKNIKQVTDPALYVTQVENAYKVIVDKNQNNVSSYVKEGNSIVVYVYNYTSPSVNDPDYNQIYAAAFSKAETTTTEEFEFQVIPEAETPWIVRLIPYMLIIGVLILFWVLASKSANGPGKIGSFSKARVRANPDEKNKVKFTDVAGADEEKADLAEVVEFLKDPQKFIRLGARIPRGILLVGPPGTGKTLLAKAVAGEADVPFYSISGSDFVEMYVGVGASRVRDLFDTARKSPSSIIFIDEIDAVGRHRGAGLGGGHDEREQTLNQLLVEMDGFGTHEGVIVIAATNRPDILDPALLRPGRFDRQITVNYPDLRGREEILKVHCRNKPLENNVDLNKIAQSTVGFTGADLANLMNEAALLAARKNKSLIGMPEIESSMLKVMVGTEKRNSRITPEEKKKTAYHEAGHAILAHILPTQDPVKRISVIPSGKALGYTLNPPVKDKFSVYKNELNERIVMLLGGRVAEKIIYDDVSGGASNDIKVATQTAKDMVTKYGMSDLLGTVRYGGEHESDEVFLGRDFNSTRDFSEETAALIDKEIKSIIDKAFQRAEELLRENIDKLHFIAEFLSKYEVMDDVQFSMVMDQNATMEELEAFMAEKEKKSREENEKAASAQKEIELEREKLFKEALGISDESEAVEQESVEPLQPEEEKHNSDEE